MTGRNRVSTGVSTGDSTRNLIWDIQAEHLDEAEFLLEMWAHSVDSPKFTVASLREGPEERLWARIDGLVVGRRPVLDRLLLPVLDEPDDDEFRTAAATLAILQGASLDDCARVLHALGRAEREGRRGLVRGLIHARRSGLIQWLGTDIEGASGSGLVGRVQVLAGYRVDAGARLIGWLRSEDLELRRAAAALARHTAMPEALRELGGAVADADGTLRWVALESALIRGMPGAWERVRAEAFNSRSFAAPHHRAALSWAALLGDEATHHRLLTELATTPTPARLWAAGCCGRVAAVDVAVALLEHPTLARLAGEVVSAIAGLPVDDERYWLDRGAAIGVDEDDALPELDDDDLDGDLRPSSDDALRRPDPDEVRSWWAKQRPRLDASVRTLSGRRLDGEQLAAGLRALPTRRRHPLALELAARTRGRAQIVSDAMTAVQERQLQAAQPELETLDLQRGLPLV
jgi:uncharacterized protein (TIGR02270 family)